MHTASSTKHSRFAVLLLSALVLLPLPSSAQVVAPPFDLPAIANAGTGSTFNLAEFQGQVVYLDFWASWCGPCRLSLPALDVIHRELKDQGFSALAVSIDVVEEDALDFLQRYPVTYPVVIDTDSAVPKAYAVDGMPSGYLIDRQGVIRSVHVGFKRGDEIALRQEIEALLATP